MKNKLAENMLRFGVKNLSESTKKQLILLSEQKPQQDPNLGLAQKIVGMIWTAMSGMGTDEQKILNAVLMIKTKDVYNSVLKIVKTSPKIKAEFGRNYPTVGAWISTDMGEYEADDIGAIDTATNAIAQKIRNHLQNVSDNPSEGLSTGWRSGIDKTLRGEQVTQKQDPNLGLAQKIVGMIWTAMSGMGTDDPKVLNAVLMIKTKDVYNSIVNILKTSPKIKAEFGRNFSTVGAWLSTDMQMYSKSQGGYLDTENTKIVDAINNHLNKFGDSGISSGGFED